MKATGIVRKVAELGRIVLPIELRRKLNLNEKDSLEIYTEDDNIILTKYQPGCLKCGSLDALVTVDDTTLCRKCLNEFALAAKRKSVS
jgi:transcriptional pleiotropic regulator of transition state genes